MRSLCWIALAALACDTAAVAQQGTPPSPQQQPIKVTGEKPAPPVQKLICKTEDTGSLIPKRMCMTVDEWQQAEKESKDQMQQMRDWQRTRCAYGMNC
jgi:hypothetical protein